MKKSSIPFAGLHAHSGVGSPFDGLGYPAEHMDFAFENGSDALALTDHGNMNGFAYQVQHAQDMMKEGKDFKPIFGVEAYFLPSISKWRSELEKAKQDKKAKRQIDKSKSGTTIEDESTKSLSKSILNRRRHLILLAQNQTGLNNIFSLVSKSFQTDNFYRFPRMDYKMLANHSEGVIATSACLGGVYAGNYWENRDSGPDAVMSEMRKTTEKMISIFGDRWYGELQWLSAKEQHELNKYIIQISKEYGIKLVSTADSHYPTRDSWKDRELYKRLGFLGKGKFPDWMPVELPINVDEIGYEIYPKNGEEMWESYKYYSEKVGASYDDDIVRESIERTHHIAHNRIDSFMPDNTVRLPSFVVPAGMSADKALVAACVEGLRDKKLKDNKEYLDRVKEELYTISNTGFSKYFLTMKAVADRATETQLTGAGRGSAAGSLVAYALGITQVDPIKYNLLFSRFLRKDTEDYPDIDYDVGDPMALKETLIKEWGGNTVVPISNFNKLQLRSLIKDISKLYSIPFLEVNAVTSKMMSEATPIAKKIKGIKAGVYTPTFEEVMEYSHSLKGFLEKYPKIKTHVEALMGQVRSVSRHAGGVVIGEDLDKRMPLINSGGVTQTPWSEGQHIRQLEPMGFIKFDILGLSTLKMIEGAISHILKRHHDIEEPSFEQVKEYYDKNLHPETINLNDSAVYKNIFQKGKWAGIFQFTEKGAQTFCKRVKPKNIIDIAAITSIFRPGPLSANVHESYVEARKNASDIKYGHKIVREITKETYGFLIFQEQIALLAHKLGKNLSLDEGNLLRKLLTKKGTGKTNEKKNKIHRKFVEGCESKGISNKKAQEIWQKFEYFSGYGFNKSHAISYSIISYQCAWLLNYYPSEWMAAFLDKEPESRKEKAINLAKKFGYKIEPMSINKSGVVWEISADNKTLIQPLTSIKGLGEKAIEQIIDHRPFNTIEEFLFNDEIVYAKLNKKAIDVLIRAEVLNELMDERFVNLKHFWHSVADNRPKNRKKLGEAIEEHKDTEDFTRDETIENKVNLSGLYPFDLILSEDIRKRLEYFCVTPISEYDEDLKLAWFIPREVLVKKTLKGRYYYIVKTLDINSEMIDIKCWGIRPDKDKIHLNRPYMAKLNHQEQWGFSTKAALSDWKLLG
jgi:DNA polymerase-3 subunit alpha